MLHKFPKKERLSGKKAIGELFKKGANSFVHPYKVIILKHNDLIDNPLRLLISVPKRNFKRAVDRNRIKRLTKEAWRMHKSVFINSIQPPTKAFDIALIYTPKTILSLKEIEPKIILILQRLTKENEVHNPTSC